MARTPTLAQRFAPLLFSAFGLLFFAIGLGLAGSNAAFERWGEDVIGTVTDTGSTPGVDGANYVAYGFTDPDGVERSGRSSGYSGTVGETILIEYLSTWPSWNRVAGAGKRPAKWQWAICGFGGLFALIGVQWGFAIRNRRRLAARLEVRGRRATGRVLSVASNTVRYEFEAPTGETIPGHTLGNPFPGLERFRAGEPAEILYDPEDPKRSVLDGEPGTDAALAA